jgi:hypothetical protein
MIYKRGQTYWYKFAWSIRQRDGTSRSFLIRRSARTKIETEAEEVEHEHRRAIRLGEVHPLDLWPKPPAPEAPILREFTTRFLEYARLHVKESSFEFYAGAVARLLAFSELANAQRRSHRIDRRQCRTPSLGFMWLLWPLGPRRCCQLSSMWSSASWITLKTARQPAYKNPHATTKPIAKNFIATF